MADKKISQLSAASTPLAGTEVLPIVQGGATVKVSAADVTAGRAISASTVAVTGSTAPANGIYLPAANSVGISTNSTNSVYINASGNVAIAEGNAPTQVLNVYRSGSTAAYMAAGNSNTGLNGTYFGVDTAGNAIINQTAALPLNIQTSGVTRIGVASAGDVTVSTGNLTFGSTGQRFIADMSNATIANRFFVQTSTTNSATTWGILPNGSSAGAAVSCLNNSDPTNASFIGLVSTSTAHRLQSAITGSGTYLPLTIFNAGAERFRVDTTGNVIVNTAAIATNATDGFLYVPSCAGTPTGTPTAYTGRVPIVVDTTNNKLYFYSNAAWRDAGP